MNSLKSLAVFGGILLANQAVAATNCQDVEHYGALSVVVDGPSADKVHVHLDGFSVGVAAQSLGGDPNNLGAYALDIDFKAEWCNISTEHASVLNCAIPYDTWPSPPTATGTFSDFSGKAVGTVEFAIFDLGLEHTTRISAASPHDYSTELNELAISTISATDNSKRADMATRYQLSYCH